eukprot:scaffold111951_cov54-Attheya_sp.AAC.2
MGKKSKGNTPSFPKSKQRKSGGEVHSNPMTAPSVTVTAATTTTAATLCSTDEEEPKPTTVSSSANGIVSTVTNEQNQVPQKLQTLKEISVAVPSSTNSISNTTITATTTLRSTNEEESKPTTTKHNIVSSSTNGIIVSTVTDEQNRVRQKLQTLKEISVAVPGSTNSMTNTTTVNHKDDPTEETPPLVNTDDDDSGDSGDSGGGSGTTVSEQKEMVALGSNQKKGMPLLLPHEERSKQYEAALRHYLRPIYNHLCTATNDVTMTPTSSNKRVGKGQDKLGFLSLMTLERAWKHVKKRISHNNKNTHMNDNDDDDDNMDLLLVQCVKMDSNLGALLKGLGGLLPQTISADVTNEHPVSLLFGVTFPVFVQCYRVVFMDSQQALDHLGHQQQLDPETVASGKDHYLSQNYVVQQRIKNRKTSLLQTFAPPSTSPKPNATAVTPPQQQQPRGKTNTAGPMKVKPSNFMLWLATYVLLLGFTATAFQLLLVVTDPMLLEHQSTSVSIVTSTSLSMSMQTSKSWFNSEFGWWSGTEEQRIARATKRVHELEQSYKNQMLHLELLGRQNVEGLERLDHLELALSKTGFLIHARETQMSRLQATIQQMEHQLTHAAEGGATMKQLTRQCQSKVTHVKRKLQKMNPPQLSSNHSPAVVNNIGGVDHNDALERLVHRRQLMGAIVGATLCLSLPWAIEASTTFVSTTMTTMASSTSISATVTAITPTLPVVVASSPTVNSISPMKALLKYMAMAWSGNNGEMVSQARNAAGTVTAQMLKP